jgi:hypothetical protein
MQYPPLQQDTVCDVLVVGGGIVGLSIAYNLAKVCVCTWPGPCCRQLAVHRVMLDLWEECVCGGGGFHTPLCHSPGTPLSEDDTMCYRP